MVDETCAEHREGISVPKHRRSGRGFRKEPDGNVRKQCGNFNGKTCLARQEQEPQGSPDKSEKEAWDMGREADGGLC